MQHWCRVPTEQSIPPPKSRRAPILACCLTRHSLAMILTLSEPALNKTVLNHPARRSRIAPKLVVTMQRAPLKPN